LKTEADKLWTDHGPAIQTMLQQIIVEKATKEGWAALGAAVTPAATSATTAPTA